ncbi:hypothetical protein [Pseudomonas sp. MD332_8]|uniref:hypothetical protein n=1 Tax=unclassified Pseudomonas TaxID=196821 RepID=UPI0036D295CC
MNYGVFHFFAHMGRGLQLSSVEVPHRTVVQPRCNSLQNFAICEIADRLQSPTARLGCSFVCTTSDFAQKKDTNPAGGRGISAFPKLFFLESRLSFINVFADSEKSLTPANTHETFDLRTVIHLVDVSAKALWEVILLTPGPRSSDPDLIDT